MEDMTNDATAALMRPATSGTPWAKFSDVGAVVTGVILAMDRRQRTEYETNAPLTNKDGTPATEIVIVLQTDERDATLDADDGRRALHAPEWDLPGCLRLALAAAVEASGATAPAIGGTFAVQHSGMNGKAKSYVARYTPPNLLAATPTIAAPTPAGYMAPPAVTPSSIF